jgi:hypothetical protein
MQVGEPLGGIGEGLLIDLRVFVKDAVAGLSGRWWRRKSTDAWVPLNPIRLIIT